MSLTLTQARPLLTKSELELFQSSRAPMLKAWSERQLASRMKRARTQRDKYRDLYRRQTVQSRARVGAAETNRRTKLKAQLMGETLERLEMQLHKLQAQAARAAARKAPAKVAAQKAPAKKSPAKKLAPRKAVVKKALAKKVPAKKAATKKTVARKGPAAPARRPQNAAAAGASSTARGAVPIGMPAKALRMNPLKAKPINKKIHASARSRQKAHTAKRDAR